MVFFYDQLIRYSLRSVKADLVRRMHFICASVWPPATALASCPYSEVEHSLLRTVRFSLSHDLFYELKLNVS